MSPTEGLSYRPASPGDLDAVRALLARCGLPSEDLTAGHLEHFVVGCSGTQVVATAGLELLGEGALFRSLAVATDCRGRGVAHELWERAQAQALGCGVREVYLLTTTAEALFARWGFRAVARDTVPETVRQTTEFTTMCPNTAVVMVAHLAAPPRA